MAKERKRSRNEMRVFKAVSPVQYYNDFISPLHPKFRKITEDSAYGLCPFHEDTDPSLSYWKKRNTFHCFGCGVGGDVIHINKLIQKRYHHREITTEESVQMLAGYYRVHYDESEAQVQHEVSIFDRARMKLLSEAHNETPVDRYNLVDFRDNNNRIIKAQGLTLESRAKNFARLDLLAGCALLNEGEI